MSSIRKASPTGKLFLYERGLRGYVYETIEDGEIRKYIDKNLSGKSDEREVKKRKSRFFILHSSFFILRELSSRTAKGKL